jgi:hypothetical protein
MNLSSAAKILIVSVLLAVATAVQAYEAPSAGILQIFLGRQK